MTITLYKNLSDTNVVDKNLDYVNTLTGSLRKGTSLLNPIFDIEANYDIDAFYDIADSDGDELLDEDLNEIGIYDTGNIFDVNYIYVAEFNRYYYVTDIIVSINNLFTFQCKLDVLKTYNSTLRTMYALISRNQGTYDDSIEDDKMPYEYYQRVDEYPIDMSNAELIFRTDLSYATSDVSHILCYYATGGLSPSQEVTQSPIDILPDISYVVGGVTNCTRVVGLTNSYLHTLLSYISNHETEASFIQSLISYPFVIPNMSSSLTGLTLGTTSVSSVNIHNFSTSPISPYFKMVSFRVNSYVGFNRGYMEFEPYSIYELYLPYYGYVELKSSDIRDSIIEVYYSIDYSNGLAKINIYNKTKDFIIKSVEATIGIKIPLNRTNNQQLADEKIQLSIKSAIGMLGSAVSIGGGAVTGNPYMIAQGIGGLGSVGIDIGEKLALMHEKAQVSNNSGTEGLYSPQTIRLKVTRYVKKEPTNYAKYYGRPLNQRVLLGDLSGYTLVKDIHLDGLDATKTEIDELYTLLTNGIIL